MVGDEPKVEIGLREIYDKVLETHSAVTNWGPRIENVEKRVDVAFDMAQSANRRSMENRKVLIWVRNITGTFATGVGLTALGAWLTHHV